MTTRKIMPTTLVMEEVRRIVGEGKNVLLSVAGRSMLPFIVGDCDRAELHPIKKPIAKGDAVLAWADGNHYVLHRVVAMDGERLTLEGDGNLGLKEHCLLTDVIARAEWVVDGRNGKRTRLTGNWAMAKWWLWRGIKIIKKILYATKKRF